MDDMYDRSIQAGNEVATASFTPFGELTRQPVEPSPGTVLGFTKQFTPDGKTYAFAAISIGTGMWFLSGPRHGGGSMHWRELLDFIGGPEQWAQVGHAVVWQKGLL